MEKEKVEKTKTGFFPCRRCKCNLRMRVATDKEDKTTLVCPTGQCGEKMTFYVEV